MQFWDGIHYPATYGQRWEKYILSYEGPLLRHLATSLNTRINLFLTCTRLSVKIAFILWLSHSYISTSSAIQWLAINKFRFELGSIAVGLVFSIWRNYAIDETYSCWYCLFNFREVYSIENDYSKPWMDSKVCLPIRRRGLLLRIHKIRQSPVAYVEKLRGSTHHCNLSRTICERKKSIL